MKIRNITLLALSLIILTHRGEAVGVAPLSATKSITDSVSAPPNEIVFQGIITSVQPLRDHDDCVRVGKDCDTLLVIKVTAIGDGVPDFEIGQSVAFGVSASKAWDYFSEREISFVLWSSRRGRFVLLHPIGC